MKVCSSRVEYDNNNYVSQYGNDVFLLLVVWPFEANTMNDGSPHEQVSVDRKKWNTRIVVSTTALLSAFFLLVCPADLSRRSNLK